MGLWERRTSSARTSARPPRSFLAAKAPERVTSLTIGGGAVRFPIEAGGALKDVIEAPSLDVVRALDARTNIGYAVEPGAGERQRARSPRGLRQRLRPRALCGVGPVRAALPRAEPGTARPVADDHDTDPNRGGRDDDLVPWSNNEYLDELLPNSEIHPLDAGHFAWEAGGRGIRPPDRATGSAAGIDCVATG